jgi:hypothetical protein
VSKIQYNDNTFVEVTGCLQWLVRESSDLETNIISVERIKEYSEKPTEVKVISKKMSVAI